jgi:hypothetical protein
LRSLIHDLVRRNIETNVMQADGVTVVRERMSIGLLLPETERGHASAWHRQVPDFLTALSVYLP